MTHFIIRPVTKQESPWLLAIGLSTGLFSEAEAQELLGDTLDKLHNNQLPAKHQCHAIYDASPSHGEVPEGDAKGWVYFAPSSSGPESTVTSSDSSSQAGDSNSNRDLKLELESKSMATSESVSVRAGPRPSSWDLWWIGVHPKEQGKGYGAKLLRFVEQTVQEEKATELIIETSALLNKTRQFYTDHGYRIREILPDFYGNGDDRIVYFKEMTASL